jgi:hypothetical protein
LEILLIPDERLLVRDLLHVIHPDETRPGPGALDRLGVGTGLRGDEALERPAHAELLGQGARVDALDAGDAVLFEVLAERAIRAPVADDGREFPDDEPGDVRAPRFDIQVVDAVIADERVGHRHDLPLVGGIGQNLLVARHRSVKADFAAGGGRRAEARTVEHRTVFEGKYGFHQERKARAMLGPSAVGSSTKPGDAAATIVPPKGS